MVIRMTLLCIRYLLIWCLFVLISSQVRKPMPPMMISAMTAMLITGLAMKYVRDEYSLFTPIRSNPALQKAEMEWNMAYHTPLKNPNSLQKVGAMTRAPSSSKRMVILMIKPVNRTIPPTLWAEMASCMVLRCFRLICFPENVEIAIATVTTPMPPIWISVRMTA